MILSFCLTISPRAPSEVEKKREKKTRLTVIVHILEILKDHTTGPHDSHFGAKNSLDFGEQTRLHRVTAVLREEDGYVPGGELLSAGLVARLLEGGGATPLVVVQAVEVDGLVGRAAVEVLGDFVTDGCVVVGGVAAGDGAVALRGDVALHITDGGFDEGVRVGVVRLVSDLIADDETQDVVVLLKLVDDGGVVFI